MDMVFESTLAPLTKLVMLSLADHANDDGRSIYPSVARLCRKTSISERAVRGTLSDLRKMQIITIAKSSSQHFPTEYTINIRNLAKIRRPARGAPLPRPARGAARPARSAARPARGAPDPSGTHHDPSRGESAQPPTQKSPLVVEELEIALDINLNGDLKTLTDGLARYAPRAGHGEKFARWWWANDFRGRKGEPPTPKQIIQLWPQAFKSHKKITKLVGMRDD